MLMQMWVATEIPHIIMILGGMESGHWFNCWDNFCYIVLLRNVVKFGNIFTVLIIWMQGGNPVPA